VTLPPGWLPVDVSAEGLSAMMDVLDGQNPQLGGLMGDEAMAGMIAEGLLFNAIDTDPVATELGMPVMLNVIALDTGISLPLDMIAPIMVGQLEEFAVPDVPIAAERVDLGGVEGEAIRYVGEVSAMAGDLLLVDFTQVVVPFAGKLYILSLSAPAGLESDYREVLDEIVTSFRLLT
jgi:hypothetical protein